MRRFTVRAVCVLALMVGSLTVTSGAQAATGNEYNDTYPGNCASNSSAAKSTSVYGPHGEYLGYLEVRYSWSCGTNWVRVVANNTEHVDKWITRPAQSGYGEFTTSNERDYANGVSTYGRQVYAPGNVHVTGCAHFVNPGAAITACISL